MTLEAVVSTFSVVGEEHKTEVVRSVEMAWAPYLDGYAHTPATEMLLVRIVGTVGIHVPRFQIHTTCACRMGHFTFNACMGICTGKPRAKSFMIVFTQGAADCATSVKSPDKPQDNQRWP